MASPTPSTSRAPQTGDAAVDVAVSGFKWILGPDRTIDWSLSNGALGETWPDRDGMLKAVSQALAAFAAVIDVKFNYLGTFTDPAAASAAGAEINLAPIRDRAAAEDSVLGFSFYPRAADGSKAGDVLVNLNSIAADYAFTPGAAGFNLLLHELGHALGLKHPFEADGAGRLTIDDTRFAPRDADWFTAMTYNDPYQSNRLKFEPSTPMPLDVAALQHLYGPNSATGAGNSVYALVADETYVSIWDAGGSDTVTAAASGVGWEINLGWDRLSGLSPNWTGFAMPAADRQFPSPHTLSWFIGEYETVVGSAFADKITGGVVANRIQGGGGDDAIDGFQGWDVAVYDGGSTDFSWRRNADGTWTVADLRPGRPEGIDTLHRIERLAFADREVDLAPKLSPALEAAFRNILRADGYSPAHFLLATALSQLPQPAAVARLVQEADASASVVSLAYQFFTGRLPGEPAFDDLVSTTSPNPKGLNADAAQALSVENRYIRFAVDLGTGEGRIPFLAEYGAKSLLDTVKGAYRTIFGAAPTDEKAHAMLDGRIGYFTAWGGDGPNGIGTKAAVVGWLLAEAAKADLGTMQTANIAFLTDLADGAAFSVDLVGTYGGAPYFG